MAGTTGTRLAAALVTVALIAVACGDSGEPEETAPPQPPPTEAPAEDAPVTTEAIPEDTEPVPTDTATTDEPTDTSAPPGPAQDIRFETYGPLGPEGTFTFTLEEDDVSFLFYAVAQGVLDPISVVAITAPDGADLIGLAGLDTDAYVNYGEVAAFMPTAEDVEMIPGDYRVTVAADGGDVAGGGVIIRSGDVTAPQAIDVTFWLVTTEDSLRDPIIQDEVAAAFREVGEAILEPHGLTVGQMTFLDAPDFAIDEFAELPLPSSEETDVAQKDLCRLMAEEVGVSRALNFAIIDRVVDPDDPEGVTEGNAPGLPGTVMVPGSALSCVVGVASPDEVEPDRDLIARANVVWHEAGHLLGLFHTTELEGDVFDIIADTPECPADEFDENGDGAVDFIECDAVDGLNFMFYDSDGTEMTAGQAFVLARHPLFYPLG